MKGTPVFEVQLFGRSVRVTRAQAFLLSGLDIAEFDVAADTAEGTARCTGSVSATVNGVTWVRDEPAPRYELMSLGRGRGWTVTFLLADGASAMVRDYADRADAQHAADLWAQQ